MNVLIPLPSTDFDPTESAVPWRLLTDAGVTVQFATPDGSRASADPRMVEGTGLGIWRPILQAAKRSRQLYREMAASAEFGKPLRWDELDASSFDGLILPGGHAPGMREYLESAELQQLTAAMVDRGAPVGAICHGVVLLARSKRADGTSVIAGRRATTLLESQEMAAFHMTRLWLGRYYRTYPQTVEAEVRAALGPDGQFESGPFALLRDEPGHLERAFFVRDENVLTARWPGDSFGFAGEFATML